MNPPTKFALMRANRPKMAIFRKTAGDLERQAIPGMQVDVLLSVGSSQHGQWWKTARGAIVPNPRLERS